MLAGLRQRFRLNATPASELGSLSLRGRAKVRGAAEPHNALLEAPITGRPCVFYHLDVSEWSNGTKTPLLVQSSHELFRLVDATGSALVDPEEVELGLRSGLVHGHSSMYLAQHRALLKGHGMGMLDDYGELRSLSFRETIIPPGSKICAMGTIRHEADPSGAASYREQPTQIILGSDAEFPLLLRDS